MPCSHAMRPNVAAWTRRARGGAPWPMSPNASAPVAGSRPHVRDRVDPDGVAEHTVRKHEREAAHDATLHAALGANIRERRADRWERGDQLHRAFDGGVEALATARPLPLIPISGGSSSARAVGANSTIFTSASEVAYGPRRTRSRRGCRARSRRSGARSLRPTLPRPPPRPPRGPVPGCAPRCAGDVTLQSRSVTVLP